MCGEQHKLRPFYQHYLGSPPRVRGTAQKAMEMGLFEGITPACAGNSDPGDAGGGTEVDHPRVCGEQFHGIFLRNAHTGSPPRVRGTAHACYNCRRGRRITPACAGNSSIWGRPRPTLWDHPRVCGEQASYWSALMPVTGSPPRVRGTGRSACGSKGGRRITPACAGNSLSVAGFPAAPKDHPRVCGEQCNPASNSIGALGSPPRVRGTDFFDLPHCFHDGITPACAGNSWKEIRD